MSNQLTKKQETFIRNNYKTMSHFAISVAVDLTENQVAYFCRKNKLIKSKAERGPYRKNIIAPAPEKKTNHLPADHTNISREQHIERWLSVQI
jgi:hypothetical protein